MKIDVSPFTLKSKLNFLRHLMVCSFAFASVAQPLMAATFDNLPELGDVSRNDLSPQMERQIGEKIMNEIRLKENSYVDDPDVGDYLSALGARLVAASADPVGNFHFFAIRDNSVNAFAMFGGYIGVNTGTILLAQSDSELAGVMAHEITHVTQNHLARQMAKEKQNTVPALVAMAIGILAARSNTQAAAASIVSTQAGLVQSQLAYSRDFEREADRGGFDILQKAGFDPRAMGDFFERLQTNTRLYDNNAPVYLQSHPLTVERISDMQNRAQSAPYRQVLSSVDFYLLRTKLRVEALGARAAVEAYETQLREKKYVSLLAANYGLAYARLKNGDIPGARKAFGEVRSLIQSSALVYGLEGLIDEAAGDWTAAQLVYRQGLQRFPSSKALVYRYADALFYARQYSTAIAFIDEKLRDDRADYVLYGLAAKNYAALGKRLQQHRMQAEKYYLLGELQPAIEQLQFAQQANDGSFYEQSAVDGRLRELKRQKLDEDKAKRNGG